MSDKHHIKIFNEITHDNNMNVVRYVLSLWVLFGHACELAQLNIPISFHLDLPVGGFFTLSGFLMFPTHQKRESWRYYIKRRALRILPPYLLIVLMSFSLLWVVSDLSFTGYFSSAESYKYLGANIIFLNFLHPDLPGVFRGPEFIQATVNGSLWTMKGEWMCYLSVPLVYMFLKKHRSRTVMILLSIITVSTICFEYFILAGQSTGKGLYFLIAKQFGCLVIYFYIGALINYLLPLFFKYKWYIFAVDILLVICGASLPGYYLLLQPWVIGSLVIWFSLIGKWGSKLAKGDNISYDIYLFHAPIIQVLVYYGLNTRLPAWIFIGTTILTTYLLAFASWRLIGRRFLNKSYWPYWSYKTYRANRANRTYIE